MLKSTALFLKTQTSRIRIGVIGCQPHRFWSTTTTPYPLTPRPTPTPKPKPTQSINIKDRKWVQQASNHPKNAAIIRNEIPQPVGCKLSRKEKTAPHPSNAEIIRDEIPQPVGHRLSRKEKNALLIKTLLEPGDSKDAIYGALDTYVAWEQKFPISALKNVLLTLEREQQWHRVVQVIKWMLSKGQGKTLGTYQQLILALDKDHRADEAHNFWMKKMGNDLHSVSWQACHLMISVYLRNAMLDHIVKLFKRLEAFGRKPPDKLIVQKVVDAYDLLDLKEDKERLLEKYDALLKRKTKESDNSDKKPKKVKSRMHTLSGRKRSIIKALKRKRGTKTQQNA